VVGGGRAILVNQHTAAAQVVAQQVEQPVVLGIAGATPLHTPTLVCTRAGVSSRRSVCDCASARAWVVSRPAGWRPWPRCRWSPANAGLLPHVGCACSMSCCLPTVLTIQDTCLSTRWIDLSSSPWIA
jgi:hypothetical protein